MTKEDVIEILERFVVGGKPCSQREIVDACASAYRMLKEQPSLPSDLDEVAKKQAETIYPKIIRTGHVAEHDVNLLTRRGFKKGFKAGAEWMTGQGDVIATRLVIDSEGRVNLNFAIGDITDENCKPKYYAGQDVIVQIRKK